MVVSGGASDAAATCLGVVVAGFGWDRAQSVWRTRCGHTSLRDEWAGAGRELVSPGTGDESGDRHLAPPLRMIPGFMHPSGLS